MTKQDIWNQLHIRDYKKTYCCSVCEEKMEYYLPLKLTTMFLVNDSISLCAKCFGVEVNDKAQEQEEKQDLSEIQRWFNYD